MSDSLAVAAVDTLGAAFLRGDPDTVLGHFASSGTVIYSGSERDEVAAGRPQLRSLLVDLFARDERYAWHTTSVVTTGDEHVLHLVAEATLRVHAHAEGVTTVLAVEEIPYRIVGTLERESVGWRWRVCHGSEPGQP